MLEILLCTFQHLGKWFLPYHRIGQAFHDMSFAHATPPRRCRQRTSPRCNRTDHRAAHWGYRLPDGLQSLPQGSRTRTRITPFTPRRRKSQVEDCSVGSRSLQSARSMVDHWEGELLLQQEIFTEHYTDIRQQQLQSLHNEK